MDNVNNSGTVVYTVDGNAKAVGWVKVSIESVRKRIGDGVRIVVCTDTPQSFGFGAECVDVRPYIRKFGLDRMCKGRMFNGREVPPMQVFRLVLPVVDELSNCDTVLFLDGDTEVVDERFNEIFSLRSDDVDCLAAQDCKWSRRVTENHIATLKRQGVWDKIPESSRNRMSRLIYANAGVMMMNLKRLRSVHGDYCLFLEQQVNLCFDYGLEQMDQSVINCLWDISIIDSRFNAWGKCADGTEFLRHYVGSDKFTNKEYPPVKYQLLREDVKPDIVYTIGRVSEHDDLELRWSLRSIAKYGRNVGRVIVTSPYKRDWLSPDVEQIEVEDLPTPGYKHHNILNAILKTVELAKLDGEFSVSSDDHFYVKSVDFAAQPMVAQHWTIPHNYGSSINLGTALWMQSCTDTKEFLYQHGLPTIDFQMHRNSRWHGGLVRERMDLFKEAFTWRFCVEPHVVMQNLWVHTQPDTRVEFRKDCKIKEFHGIEPWCDCISCYDETFNDKAFMEFMNREFGDKCRYER